MKITFSLLLVIVALALAMPADKDENSHTTMKEVNSPTKTEKEKNEELARPEEKEDKSKTEESKISNSKEKVKDSSEEENEESLNDDIEEEISEHGSSKGKEQDSSEENEEESSEGYEEDSTSTEEQTTYPPLTPEEERCGKLVGTYVNDKFVGPEINHDLPKILEKYGGPPGKVNATWTKTEDAPVEENDLEKRPLLDADPKYWIYTYGASDAKTYIRIEHAVRRFSGTPKAFLEIRGEVYFTPEDFCGKSRRATYTVDDRGFKFEVSHEYCLIDQTVTCYWPISCKADEDGKITSCVAAPSYALLAALIGGGK